VEAGKRANHAKSVKTCHRYKARENIQPSTGAKREKASFSFSRNVCCEKLYHYWNFVQSNFLKSGFIFYVVDYLAQVFDVLKTDLKDDVVSGFSPC